MWYLTPFCCFRFRLFQQVTTSSTPVRIQWIDDSKGFSWTLKSNVLNVCYCHFCYYSHKHSWLGKYTLFKNASKLMEVDTKGCGGGNDKSLTWQQAPVEFDNQVIKVCGSHSSAGGQWQQLWGDSTLTPAASPKHLAEDEHAIVEMDWGEAALFRWPYMMYWTPPATLLPSLLDSIFLLLQQWEEDMWGPCWKQDPMAAASAL